MMIFEIPLRLPGLNEYQRACRGHALNGAYMKKNTIASIMTYLTPAKKVAWPCQIDIFYEEGGRKRDIDNITGFGAKCILDAIVKAGILPDDGPDYINKLSQEVHNTGTNKIIVQIYERGDERYVPMDTTEQVFAHAAELLPEPKAEDEPWGYGKVKIKAPRKTPVRRTKKGIKDAC